MANVVDVQRAEQRARRLYPKNKGFRGAYTRGARAALAGRPVDTCPYRREAGNTWRTVWRLAWLRGYQSIAPPEDS